jgi:CheY-like chemotaxis protein
VSSAAVSAPRVAGAGTPDSAVGMFAALEVRNFRRYVEVSLPLLARDTFHGTAATYGWLVGSLGFGAVIGLSRRGRLRRGCHHRGPLPTPQPGRRPGRGDAAGRALTGGSAVCGGIAPSRNAASSLCHHDRMPLRCLLVDDSDAFVEAASVLLQREGVMVAGVASGTADALRQARALRPDVILVDIGLGEESGFDLARLLARDGQGGGAAVILISTRAESDYAELIAESPAAGFLAKSELSAREISRILGHTP